MRLTENQITTLKPCIKNVTLTGKKVNVVCSGIASGKRALLVLRTAYSPSSVEVISGMERTAMLNFLQIWIYPFRYRDFTLCFNSTVEAEACANDLSLVIAQAVEDGVIGEGIGNEGSGLFGSGLFESGNGSFFKSNFFYGAIVILVVIAAAVVGVKVIQHKK